MRRCTSLLNPPRVLHFRFESAQQYLSRSGGRGISGAIASSITNSIKESSDKKASERHAAMDKNFFQEQLILAKIELNEVQENEKIRLEQNPLDLATRRLISLDSDPYYQDRPTKRFNKEVKEYKETSETYKRIEKEYAREMQRYRAHWVSERSKYQSLIMEHEKGISKTSKVIVSLENILTLIDEGNPSAAKIYITECSQG